MQATYYYCVFGRSALKDPCTSQHKESSILEATLQSKKTSDSEYYDEEHQ